MLRAWSVGFTGFRLIIRVESSEFRVSGLVPSTLNPQL